MSNRKKAKILYLKRCLQSGLRRKMRRLKKLKARRIHNLRYNSLRSRTRKKRSNRKLFSAPLSSNVKHFKTRTEELKLNKYPLRKGHALFEVPKIFSLCEAPEDSYQFILSLFNTLLKDSAPVVQIDYKDCTKIDLDAQVMMDVILKEFIDHRKLAKQYGHIAKIKSIVAVNYQREHIMKILFSIGSFKILKNIELTFQI